MVQLESSRLPPASERIEFNSNVFRRVRYDTAESLEPRHGFVPLQDQHFALKKDLALRIAKLVHLEQLRDLENVSQESLVHAGQDTLIALNRIQNEWLEFLRRLVRIDISRLPVVKSELERDARDAMLQAAVDRVVDGIFGNAIMKPHVFSSPFTADALSRDLTMAREEALSAFVSSISQLVERMMKQLDALVEYSVCGLITRLPKGTCKFSYRYRKMGMQDLSERMGPGERIRGPLLIKCSEIFYDAKFDLTICYREHHLIEMIETDPSQGVVRVPAFHQRILDSVPDWLSPSTSLVEGIVIGIVEGDRHEDAFELEQPTGVKIYYHGDPALVLGQHVLTAWGPEELSAEVSKGKHAEQVDSVLKRVWKSLKSI